MNKTQTEENLLFAILQTAECNLPAHLQELCEFVREERLNAMPRDVVEGLASLLRESKRAKSAFNKAHSQVIESSQGALSYHGLIKMLEELLAHQGPK